MGEDGRPTLLPEEVNRLPIEEYHSPEEMSRWDVKRLKFHLKQARANKVLKAAYGNCTPELFAALFPKSAGKKKAPITLVDLEIDRLGKALRYGGSLEHVPGSLSAQFDEATRTVSVTGKYTMV